MINAIIEAISIALSAEFNEKPYKIHMEEMKQGLKEPCFFISCLNPSSKPYPGQRYFRANQFVIQYFPESTEQNRECHEIAERMLWCLEYITADGDEKPIRGTQKRYEIVDGVLNFFVKNVKIQPIYESKQNRKGE